MKLLKANAGQNLLLLAAMPIVSVAHHSAAMFDLQKTITVTGTVTSFQYTNPHSWLIILGKGPDGKVQEWSFEADGPSTLMRAGIKVSAVVPGDKITMTTHPMKDGRPAGTWLTLTKSDGTVLAPRGAPPPGGKAPAPAG
jgi:Family of unknown function (DUF6152)